MFRHFSYLLFVIIKHALKKRGETDGESQRKNDIF